MRHKARALGGFVQQNSTSENNKMDGQIISCESVVSTRSGLAKEIMSMGEPIPSDMCSQVHDI